MSRRTERVEDLLRAELSELLQRHLHDPRVRLASVVAVHVTPDLRRAAVQVSVLGPEAERLDAIAALQHARGFLRSQLAHRLRRLRVTPELVFQLDRGAEYAEEIDRLLETLHDDDEGP